MERLALMQQQRCADRAYSIGLWHAIMVPHLLRTTRPSCEPSKSPSCITSRNALLLFPQPFALAETCAHFSGPLTSRSSLPTALRGPVSAEQRLHFCLLRPAHQETSRNHHGGINAACTRACAPGSAKSRGNTRGAGTLGAVQQHFDAARAAKRRTTARPSGSGRPSVHQALDPD